MSRPYSLGLLAGIGVGLSASSGVLLALAALGIAPTGFDAFLKWLGLFTTGLGLMLALAPWIFAEPEPYTPPKVEQPYVPASAAPVVLRRIRINDRTGMREIDLPERRPARWVAWQLCIEDTLEWARERGGITSGVMVGQSAMFSDRGQWVDVTNVMAGQQLCEKANGRVTRLTGNVDDLLARVREGRCEWPVDRDPPAHSPAPVSVRAESVLAA